MKEGIDMRESVAEEPKHKFFQSTEGETRVWMKLTAALVPKCRLRRTLFATPVREF